MTRSEFKVLDWLRSVRDEHGDKVKGWTPEQILQETKDKAAIVQQEIEDLRKQITERKKT